MDIIHLDILSTCNQQVYFLPPMSYLDCPSLEKFIRYVSNLSSNNHMDNYEDGNPIFWNNDSDSYDNNLQEYLSDRSDDNSTSSDNDYSD